MNIAALTLGALETNCYLVVCPETLEAAVIDPGGDAPRILAAIRSLSTAFQKSVGTSEMLDGAGGLEGRAGPSKGLQRKDATDRSVLKRHRGEAPVEDSVSQGQADLRNAVLSAPVPKTSPNFPTGALRAKVKWILNTHGHADHLAANAALKGAFPDAKLAVHQADAQMLVDAELNLSGAFGMPVTSPPADVLLHDGDKISFGSIRLEVIHVPGHTPGSIALYKAECRVQNAECRMQSEGRRRALPATADGRAPGSAEGRTSLQSEFCDLQSAIAVRPVLFSGDALFQGGIGRSDFPGGCADHLIRAIRTRLLTLPAETEVFPGHGGRTTIGKEAQSNPFLR